MDGGTPQQESPPQTEGSPVPLPHTGRHVLISFNRIAGAGGREAKVARLLEKLKDAGYEATICPTAESLEEQVHSLDPSDLRAIVAAGGDGTLSWIANRVPPETTLMAFPLGTENLLARYLGHLADPQSVIRLLAEGEPMALDAGEANGRLFSLMAGCGFDAEVVEQLHRNRRGNIRHWTYIKPMLDTMWSYAYPRLTVRVLRDGGEEETIECRWAFVVNVPRYAFALEFDPQATPLDGLLNVVTFRDGSLLAGINYLAAVAWGSHVGRSDVCFRQTTRVRIESHSHTRYQLDGDPGGELPLEVRCLPQRLRVLVTPEWKRRLEGQTQPAAE